jgi:predicted Rossmann fold nucleotide-binding protein DprA/Smf involved in DNA uptake
MPGVILDAEVTTIGPNDMGLRREPNGPSVPLKLWAAGPVHLLADNKTGFLCSSQCPGGVILKTFDAVTAMRDAGHTLIGGFHSPMEWECLGILLRGRQPVIWMPARSIVGMHLKPELQQAFAAGRLLIVSPFGPQHKRITAALAGARNRFVGALADRVFVAHAAPGSRTLALCEELRASGRNLCTVDDPANAPLLTVAEKLPVRPTPIEAHAVSART